VKVSARALNRATLARQLLLRREPVGVVNAVRRVVALQAQHPASPYLALWNRLGEFDPAHLDAAFAARAVVKATLMRVTLHAVHAGDYAALHTAMQPTLRGARYHDRRFKQSGLTSADADALVPALLKFTGEPRAAADVQGWVDAQLETPHKGVWWALRQVAPLLHAPNGPTWSFGTRPWFVAARPEPDGDVGTPDEALTHLVRRYLEGFGPASMLDVAQFALVNRPRARAALAALSDDLEHVHGPDGTKLFDVPGALRPPEDTPAPPRLLPMWDSVLLAYADRSRVIPPEYRTLVARSNGDVLPTLLVDGYVAGVWRPVDGGIEATAFHPLSDEVWDALSVEARDLTRLLATREPLVYSRYAHWWAKLPTDGHVRVLPG
jgi:hypothetical protein